MKRAVVLRDRQLPRVVGPLIVGELATRAQELRGPAQHLLRPPTGGLVRPFMKHKTERVQAVAKALEQKPVDKAAAGSVRPTLARLVAQLDNPIRTPKRGLIAGEGV